MDTQDRILKLRKTIELNAYKYYVEDNPILEDYEYDIFGLCDGVIDFSMGIELLVKLIKPDAVSTIFTDRLIDVETGLYLTEFDKEKVFKEDFGDK